MSRGHREERGSRYFFRRKSRPGKEGKFFNQVSNLDLKSFQGGILRSILVVEDEQNLLELYRCEFEDVGFTVLPAASGQEAIASVKKQRPDVVVLDIKLNDMEGLKVLDEIKSIDKTIPVIINSAYSVYKSDFSSWMADDYIVKSSDISLLLNKVKELVDIG